MRVAYNDINRMTGPDCAVICNLINTHTHMLPVCRIPVSICCAKRRETSFTHVLEGDKPAFSSP